ncbi:hypothetical protein BC941DRAFT_511235 [Chlamydoabsidia padenii]|nr:hypothetical protein BC941DRAFT_511235 [Chlamydoabsidia padenii]
MDDVNEILNVFLLKLLYQFAASKIIFGLLISTTLTSAGDEIEHFLCCYECHLRSTTLGKCNTLVLPGLKYFLE